MKNKIKEKLQTDELILGHFVFEFSTPGIAQILAQCGFEFVVFDSEHAGLDARSVSQLMAWAKAADIVRCLRVPMIQYQFISRALDAGAQRLVIPRVETRQEVEAVVEAMKYPPLGNRGVAFGIAHDDYTGGDVVQKMAEANQQTLLIVQIESQKGLDHLDEILSVDGVDIGWVGHYDLTLSMGIPGEFRHPRFLEALNHTAAICRKYHRGAGAAPASVEQALVRRPDSSLLY